MVPCVRQIHKVHTMFEACQSLIAYVINIPATLAKKQAEVFLWILGTFRDLQDALLAVGLIRTYALHVLEQHCAEAITDALCVPR